MKMSFSWHPVCISAKNSTPRQITSDNWNGSWECQRFQQGDDAWLKLSKSSLRQELWSFSCLFLILKPIPGSEEACVGWLVTHYWFQGASGVPRLTRRDPLPFKLTDLINQSIQYVFTDCCTSVYIDSYYYNIVNFWKDQECVERLVTHWGQTTHWFTSKEGGSLFPGQGWYGHRGDNLAWYGHRGTIQPVNKWCFPPCEVRPQLQVGWC